MTTTVLTFQPGDPVPPWLISVEPRDDVPAGTSAILDPLQFSAQGRVVDDGCRYVIELDGGRRQSHVVVARLRNCHLMAERPILWPDGAYWPGIGVPQPAAWTPDPERVKRIAAVERSREALLSGRLELTAALPEPTYYKAAALVGAGVVIGLLIMGAVVGTVLAVLT